LGRTVNCSLGRVGRWPGGGDEGPYLPGLLAGQPWHWGRDLYITTSWFDCEPDSRAAQPLAGAIFRCRPGVTGPPSLRYAGVPAPPERDLLHTDPRKAAFHDRANGAQRQPGGAQGPVPVLPKPILISPTKAMSARRQLCW